MYKERFPNHRKLKLQSRDNGQFQVVKMINDNAYKINFSSEYDVNATFNVAKLTLFELGLSLRSNSFEERDNDID
jgi:hypothetical protein